MTHTEVHGLVLVHRDDTGEQSICVYDFRGRRFLIFGPVDEDTLGQSVMDLSAPEALLSEYTQGMVASVAMHPLPIRVLAIGVGGGTIPKALRHVFPALHIDAVDLDPAVIRIACEFFALHADERLALHTMEARAFVRHAGAAGVAYDVILLDACGEVSVPSHLMTVEFLGEVKAALAPGGRICSNYFKTSGAPLDRELATHAAVFGDLLEIDAGLNRLIVAGRDGLSSPAALLRTLRTRRESLRRLGVADSMAQRLKQPQPWDPRARVASDGDR